MKWKEWVKGLTKLGEIAFDRCAYPSLTQQGNEISLHGFAGASCKAYYEAIYFVCRQGKRIHSQLLTSKTRVTPIKQQTIPQLELTAARILAVLMHTVKKCEGQTLKFPVLN